MNDELPESSSRAFRLLLDRGSATRPELAEALAVTKQTVSTAMAELERLELASPISVDRGRVGRSAVRYAVSPRAGWVFGVDLGAARSVISAARLDGTVVAERTLPNPAPTVLRDWEDQVSTTVTAMGELAPRACDAAGPLRGMAFAVPQPVPAVRDLRTTGAGAVDSLLLADLAPFTDVPIWVENDVNCAALARPSRPDGSGHDSVLYLHVDVGLGAALLIDGRVIRGQHGRAGEIRNLPSPLDIEEASGSAEADLNAEGLLARAGHSTAAPLIGALDDLFAEAALDDGAAERAIALEVQGLARLIETISVMTDPGQVVLAGLVGQRPEVSGRVADECRRRGMTAAIATDPLGDRAASIGAARVAIREVVESLAPPS